LQITPINIEVPAPGAASTVTLNNPGGETINAQIRVFKWIQHDGEDQLVPTTEVVVSPPAVKLTAGKKSVIRVVRLGKSPAATEETYRLIVDELPKPVKAGQAGVGFTLRSSIPVFFSKNGQEADLSWQAVMAKGQLVLKAENSGGRRVRLASLAVVNGSGKTIRLGEGLAGYVLGQSSRQWTVKGASKAVTAGGSIKITA